MTDPEDSFPVEQQAYISASDGRIDWMRVACSGYRPVTAAPFEYRSFDVLRVSCLR
ncbi:MAG TPA: hypothetical protein VFW29_08660 [Solirubrobacteraceae bacterium]|nr:hypothetical protein [Solirubrobacteraceae bacterium]